jgi:hypothetical protein
MWKRTVHCLVRIKLLQLGSALPELSPLSPSGREVESDAAEFVQRAMWDLPAFLRLPMVGLCWALAFYLPATGRISPSAARVRALRFLPGSGLLNRFVSSLVLLRVFDKPLPVPASPAEAPHA